MRREQCGTYVATDAGGEKVKAFVPYPLPPDPPIFFTGNLSTLLTDAALELGRMDSLTLVPEAGLFLYQYVRKEAVLSSRIEGTQSTLEDLLSFEDDYNPGVPVEDVIEVSNYVAALEHGKKRIVEDNFPISSRMLKEIHGILLSRGRGKNKAPGEFKRSQNWIGGTRPGNAVFVPTPPVETAKCMSDLEKFIHSEHTTHPIVKAGLAHAHFETIHPFLDGNGRLGRMMITLMLVESGIMSLPILYLSLYFKTYREEYYSRLQAIRTRGEWEEWLEFYLEGIRVTAKDAVNVAGKINDVFEHDYKTISSSGKSTNATLQVHKAMMERQTASPKRLASMTGLSMPSVMTGLKSLAELGIVSETTGQQRNTRYRYDKTHAVLSSEIGAFSS